MRNVPLFERPESDCKDWSDADIEKEIAFIEGQIESWAKGKSLWHDSGFMAYLKYSGGDLPECPTVTVLYSDGELVRAVTGEHDYGVEEEFIDLLESWGYYFEFLTHSHLAIYSLNKNRSKKFSEYFYWKWVCELIKEDTADVYEEIYTYFIQNPQELHRLHWRDFEVLLFRLFQNHGFEAVLGPGRNDEGVDITLFHTDPIGDVMTFVQAKKYAPKRGIGLNDVAALYGIGRSDGADSTIFVTTSKYEPVAKRFANRNSEYLALAGKEDVIQWCEKASQGVIKDKSSLLQSNRVESLMGQALSNKPELIVHATWGYNMVHNQFALVVKESQHAALLIGLSNSVISHDGYGQSGIEVPDLDKAKVLQLLTSDNVWRVKRLKDEVTGKVSYWGQGKLFSLWDGKPTQFNYMD